MSFWKRLIGRADPAPQAEPTPHRASLFSTEFEPQRSPIAGAIALGRSIQRSATADIVTTGTGDASIQEVKALNSGAFSGVPDAQFNWYSGQGFIGFQACAILAQQWLIDKACTIPAQDAVRNGWKVTRNDGQDMPPEIEDKLRQVSKRMRLTENLVEAARMNRIFGIRIVLFRVDSTDPDYYEKPFNPDGVTPGSYRGMVQVDPYWITPELSARAASDPAAPDFYEPTWWRIGGKRYHRTHLVVCRTSVMPDILKPTYLYAGLPVPQKIAERVYAAERTANEGPQLAMSKRTTVMGTDLAQFLANQEAATQQLNIWAWFRDNFGVKVIDKEADQIQQFETSLADLDSVIMTQYQIVAAASNVPATKLLGTTPKGFNATGEYEEANYHEELGSLQSHVLTPIIERHNLLAIRSEVSPNAPFETTVVWNPLDAMTMKEVAEVNKIEAETDAILVGTGAIDGYDVRQRLKADPDSGYNGLADPEDEEASSTDDEA